MKHSILTSAIWILLFTVGCNEVKNYDDCILQNVKEDMNTQAVNAIVASCRGKFPEHNKRSGSNYSNRNLTSDELTLLDGNARHNDGVFEVSMYNGNESLIITEILISVQTIINGVEETNLYREENISIKPKTTSEFTVNITSGDVGADYSWSVVLAKGF